jgi:hypothetical protein
MMHAVEIGLGYTTWKQGAPVPPGEYYKLDHKPDEVWKKRLATRAVADPNGQWYGWITPREDWVRYITVGMFIEEASKYGEKYEQAKLDRIRGYLGGFDLSRLYPWQLREIYDCVTALEAGWTHRRGLLVSLGGGKTLVGLLLAMLGDTAVVFGPTHVHDTWRRNAEKWNLPCPPILTYEGARKVEQADVIICDEVLFCKNPEAARSRRISELAKKASIVLGLTGTPTSVSPMDFRWLNALWPGCTPSSETSWKHLFSDKATLKDVNRGQKAYVVKDKDWDLDKISKYTAPFVLRVDTSELVAYLPPVSFEQCTVPRPKDFDIILKGAATTRGASKRVTQARTLSDGFIVTDEQEIVRLDTAKLDAIEQIVEGAGEPVVVMANWRESIRALSERLQRFNPSVIYGQTPDMGLQQARFLSGETDVLILSSRMTSGIDGLQDRCRIAVFMSNSSSPVDREQAIGRFQRVGQKGGVQIIDVIAEGTLDARQLELLTNHKELSAAMLEKILADELEAMAV